MKITELELQAIIKEEAMRLKKRMMLESEKNSILKQLNEMEECGMMEDLGPDMSHIPSESPSPEAIEKVTNRTSAIMSQVNPEIANKVVSELEAAGFMGASEDEIKQRISEMLPMNESLIGEGFNKSTLYNWLIGGGLSATVAGLVATAIGSLSTQELSNAADFTGDTVIPSVSTIAGLVAAAIGAITIAAGKHGKSQMDMSNGKSMDQATAEKIIAARKMRQGR